MSRWTKLAVAGVATAGLLAVPASLFGVGWVYFEACGFVVTEDKPDIGAIMQKAPNISGYWVKKHSIIAVVDWRTYRGKACTSIYALGADRAVHVVGTTEEVLEKLGVEK